MSNDKIHKDLMEYVIKPVVPAKYMDDKTIFHLNPSGRCSPRVLALAGIQSCIHDVVFASQACCVARIQLLSCLSDLPDISCLKSSGLVVPQTCLT